MSAPVVWFEIMGRDAETLRSFYGELFDWQFRLDKNTDYGMVDKSADGIPGGVGYQLQRGFELPPLMFNAAEVEALVLGARVVETWGDPELAAAVRSAMAMVEEILPEPLRRLLFDTPLYAPAGPHTRKRR